MSHSRHVVRAGIAPPLTSILLVFALLLLLIGVGVGAAGCGPSGLEEVRLDSGPITGALEKSDQGDVWTFKGIPYAAPPVGELRWKPPQPVEPWDEP
ncbi:MAG: carboxylesterase family protein, partial [Actinobacteria bacterium]|nr:carboxylesterase family protein [Actinomycetota bacterium]